MTPTCVSECQQARAQKSVVNKSDDSATQPANAVITNNKKLSSNEYQPASLDKNSASNVSNITTKLPTIAVLNNPDDLNGEQSESETNPPGGIPGNNASHYSNDEPDKKLNSDDER